MILTCAECTSQFRIDPEDLHDEGRMVRCGECGHKWFQEPVFDDDLMDGDDEDDLAEDVISEDFLAEEDDEDETGEFEIDLSGADDAIEAESGAEIPVAEDPAPTLQSAAAIKPGNEKVGASKKGRIAALALFIGICFTLIILKPQITQIWPDSYGAYSLFGGGEDYINMNDISFERFEAIQNGDEVTLSGLIYNLTPHEIHIPSLIAEVKNNNNDIIEEVEFELDDPVIPEEGTIKIEKTFTLHTQNAVQSVDLRPLTFLD